MKQENLFTININKFAFGLFLYVASTTLGFVYFYSAFSTLSLQLNLLEVSNKNLLVQNEKLSCIIDELRVKMQAQLEIGNAIPTEKTDLPGMSDELKIFLLKLFIIITICILGGVSIWFFIHG